MKIQAILSMILVLTPSVCGQRSDRLEGCVDPKLIRVLLTKIGQADSEGISLEQVRVLWPNDLTDIECENKTTRSLKSEDRIVNGHCQCCSVFSFKVDEKSGVAHEQVDGITVNYSSREHQTLAR